MAKSPAEMKAAMISGLPQTTGKSLPEWLQIVQSSKLGKHKEIVTMLKSEHKLTHGFANMIALQALNSDSHTQTDTASLVDSQYAGAKAGLRPLYDAIVTAVQKFGPDVEVSPKKGYVSLRRKKQFAIVQPSSSSRLDLGINLKGVVPTSRLEASGSFNAMVSHRVKLSKPADLDKEVLAWMKKAYEEA
jgi:hypothetical protein